MYAYNRICIQNRPEKTPPNPHPPKPSPGSPRPNCSCLPPTPSRRRPARTALPEGKNLPRPPLHPLVTLLYLLFQRLKPDHTLDAALTDAQSGGGDRINPKLSRGLKSASTASYSDARRRLPWEFLAEALRLQGRKITAQFPAASWKSLGINLLDGSTVRLRPYGNIACEFASHGNQHRHRAYWCLMRVTVSFCCLTGAALDCVLGSTHLSEQAMGAEIILRALGRCLFIGDRNFGVFRVVQAARHNQQHVLLRLTEMRAVKLLGHALCCTDRAIHWTPTRHDKLPPDLSREPVAGRIIVCTAPAFGFSAPMAVPVHHVAGSPPVSANRVAPALRNEMAH